MSRQVLLECLLLAIVTTVQIQSVSGYMALVPFFLCTTVVVCQNRDTLG